MGGVDIMDQGSATYRLNWKSSVRFYLRIFFDLMDVACVNSYAIYNMKHPWLQDCCRWKPNSIQTSSEKGSTNVETI